MLNTEGMYEMYKPQQVLNVTCHWFEVNKTKNQETINTVYFNQETTMQKTFFSESKGLNEAPPPQAIMKSNMQNVYYFTCVCHNVLLQYKHCSNRNNTFNNKL